MALVTLLTSLNVYAVPANAAGTESLLKTANIEYNAVDTLSSHQSVFYKKKVITTKAFVLDAGTGKIITKIVLKKDGQPFQTITVNAKTYNNTVTLNGEVVPVKSIDNTPYGTWIAWQRSIAGTNWIPGTSGNDWGITGNSDTGSETIGGVVKDRWPGKTVYMNLPYTRNKAYESIGPVDYGTFATTYIDDTNLNSNNPFQVGTNVKYVWGRDVQGSEASDVMDPSTVITGMEVIDLNTTKIRFTQNYDHEGARVKLGGNGSAAMMYYFAIYTFDIKSFTYRYPDTYEVYIKDDDGTTIPGPTDPGPGQGTTPVPTSCTTPSAGQSIIEKFMDPVVTAKIRADARGSEQFDVLQGIPTSESLYGNVSARNYLYQDEFVQMTGKCTFSVNVTKEYTLKWDPGQPSTDAQGKPITIPDPQSETESKTYQYKIERPYSYWTIKNLEVYQIDQASLVNYALPNSGIVIQPNGYTAPYYSASTNGNYYPPAPPDEVQATGQTVSGGKTKPNVPDDQSSLKSSADKVVEKVEVENDYFEFNGQKILNNSRVKETGPTPGQIPAPQQIGDNVLYSPNHLVSSSKVNKRDTPSSGMINYGLMPGNINGGTDQQFAINGINTVTVHTPVVNYSSVTDDWAHNQKTTPTPNRAAFILDRPFTVRIPTSGQHVNYPGYGNRDYSKYIMTKQVYFPFDVYKDNQTLFIPKKTWIDVPINQLDTTFFLPVWVDEGDYTVYFRTIAENSPTQLETQPDANVDLINHVATDEVSVEVIGRIYDFQVTDIADYNWETVFRVKKGDFTPRGVSYWVGTNSIDGAPRGNLSPYLLPIAPGSHPQRGYKNVSVKTGYHFKFDLKTKGNMFELQDGIDITPSFYFVSKDGKTRQSVDLYYNSGSKTMIKIGSTQDTVKRYVILNERLRNLPQQELTNTASYRYNHDALAQKDGSSSQFSEKYINTLTKEKTWVGSYSALTLSSNIRTLIGPTVNIPNGVDQERANAAIQHWYGEYSIPADVYAVKKGTNVAEYARTKGLDDHSSIFLKNGGYIVVNFDMETLQNGDVTHPHLQYIHAPLMNQWQMEGFNRTYTDPKGQKFTLQDGDVVFYHANVSSRDDFDSQVPH